MLPPLALGSPGRAPHGPNPTEARGRRGLVMRSSGVSLLGTEREKWIWAGGEEQTETSPAEGTYGLGHVQFSVNKGIGFFEMKERERRLGARVLRSSKERSIIDWGDVYPSQSQDTGPVARGGSGVSTWGGNPMMENHRCGASTRA